MRECYLTTSIKSLWLFYSIVKSKEDTSSSDRMNTIELN